MKYISMFMSSASHKVSRLKLLPVVFAFWLYVMPQTVLAALSAGEVGRNVKDSFEGLGIAAWAFSMFIGFCLVVGGLTQLALHRKTKTEMTSPFVMMICGAVLISIMAIIATLQTTAFGHASSNLGQIGIG